jgi:excinuclease ABC subunit C
VIVPFELPYEEPGITVTVPKSGDKKKLLELAEKNVRYFIENIKAKERLQLNSQPDKYPVLLQIKEDLQLPGSSGAYRML